VDQTLNASLKIMLHSVFAEMDTMEIQKIASMDANQNPVHVKQTQIALQIHIAMDWFVNQLAHLTLNVLH
jgi:uncharacterized protein